MTSFIEGLAAMLTPEQPPRVISPLKRYAIWWTTGDEVRAIDAHFDCLPTGCPDYLRAEWVVRRGHNGRGRLWVAPEFDGHLPRVEFHDDSGSALETFVGRHCAGIVVHARDLFTLAHLPGIVTTLTLERWL